MSLYTFEQTKAGYLKLWTETTVRPERKSAAAEIAAKIVANKSRYQIVERNDGVPWFVVGTWHYRESNFNFGTYLGNGQSLLHITTEVPAGRGPFSSFEAGASDALRGLKGIKWSIERILYETEKFNGQGYFSVHPPTNSPYVWSWTTAYNSGKYVRDHVYDENFKDPQCGCAAILKELEASGAITLAFEDQPMVTATPIPGTTTTTVITTPHFQLPPINIAEIDSAISTLSAVLPIIATFVPPLKVALPFLPILKGLVDMAAELESAPPGTDIAGLIAAHLHTVADQVKAAVPPR